MTLCMYDLCHYIIFEHYIMAIINHAQVIYANSSKRKVESLRSGDQVATAHTPNARCTRSLAEALVS